MDNNSLKLIEILTQSIDRSENRINILRDNNQILQDNNQILQDKIIKLGHYKQQFEQLSEKLNKLNKNYSTIYYENIELKRELGETRELLLRGACYVKLLTGTTIRVIPKSFKCRYDILKDTGSCVSCVCIDIEIRKYRDNRLILDLIQKSNNCANGYIKHCIKNSKNLLSIQDYRIKIDKYERSQKYYGW